MEVEKVVDGDVVVLRCKGRLNMVAAPALRTVIDEVVEQGTPRVVVDLEAASFVDSSGLGALVGGLRSARVAGGDLRIAGATEQVRTVLALTKLDRVLRTYATVAEAKNDF